MEVSAELAVLNVSGGRGSSIELAVLVTDDCKFGSVESASSLSM